MAALKKLFTKFPPAVAQRHYSQACQIQNQLFEFYHFQSIGGRKLLLAPNLIRFKLGSYRLIFELNDGKFLPLVLIHRKNLTSFLKRR